MKELEEYHRVWLNSHSWRTEEWLRDRLKDGFHIHHLDGNHYNNDPKNLILIDGSDHMHLHGMPLEVMARGSRQKPEYGPTRYQMNRFVRMYEARHSEPPRITKAQLKRFDRKYKARLEKIKMQMKRLEVMYQNRLIRHKQEGARLFALLMKGGKDKRLLLNGHRGY